MDEMNFSWIILAGGESRRMGQPKQTLPWKDGTVLDAAVEKAKQAGAGKVLISANRAYPPYRCVMDRVPGAGPLGGIHACLLQASSPLCLVVPVDVPLFPGELASQMIRYARDSGRLYLPLCWNGTLEPLIGVFHRDTAPIIEGMLTRQENKVRSLTRYVSWEPFSREGDPVLMENCNTPETYRQLYARFGMA